LIIQHAVDFSSQQDQGKLTPGKAAKYRTMTATRSEPFLRLPIVMILAIIVSACATQQDPVVILEPAVSAAPEYDMNSWKTIIGDECRSFSDGCNNCFRGPGKMAACTRKACLTYQQPRCLDKEAAAESAPAAKRVDYACDEDRTFSVSYHEFVQDDQRVRLQESEIMFSDHQTGRNHRLRRAPSASGEQYIDSTGFKFFAKGDEALVMEQNTRLYSGCKIKL
jgi:membrane-bound inhibitor of C-type lysozyme